MRTRKILAFVISLTLVLTSLPVLANMKAIGDDELAGIRGQEGFSLLIKNIFFLLTGQIGDYSYTDTDTGSSIEFKNITFDDGEGGELYFDGLENPLTIDLITVDDAASPIDGKTVSVIEETDWDQILYLSAESVVFCNKDLGSLDIDNISQPSFHLYITSHGEGVSAELGIEHEIGEARYTYNTVPASLKVGSIHLAKSAAGAPETPVDWDFSGRFRIGNLFDGDPAAMDIATRIDNNKTFILLNLPADGCLRIKDIDFGGTDFGPCAIDGITVHKLQVQIPGV